MSDELQPGCRVVVLDEPPLPSEDVRRGWLLRSLGADGALLHMSEIYSERVPLNRLVLDTKPRNELHYLDQVFDRRLPLLLAAEKDTSDDELTLRTIELHTAPMTRMFLLDTSALRAVSTAQIVEWSKKYRFGYSSYSAWELLADIERDFKYSRAALLKTQHMRLLDDPHRMFLVGARHYEPKSIEDADTLKRLLPIIERSHSWEEFRRECIAAGQPHLALLGQSVRSEFDFDREARHVDYIRRFVAAIRDREWDFTNDEAAFAAISHYIDEEIEHAKAIGAHPGGLRERMTTVAYVRAAYLIQRGRVYAERGLAPDGNDYVDAAICWHLHLHYPCTLVTNDSGFADAVEAALALLTRLDVGYLPRVLRHPLTDEKLEEALN